MGRSLMGKAFFLAAVFVLSANWALADTVRFNAPLTPGEVFVMVKPEKVVGESRVTVRTAWGDWSREEGFTVNPPAVKGVVIKLQNQGSDAPTVLTVTAANGTVAKVVQMTGGAIEEWNSGFYISVGW